MSGEIAPRVRPEVAVIANLPADSRATLMPYLRLSLARDVRNDERDRAIRATASLLSGASRSEAAQELARVLRQYLASAWRHERAVQELPESAGPMRRALHRIAHAGRGKALGWQQIRNVLDGHRG